MNSPQSLNEASLARECLQRLGEEGGVLAHASHVLELISHTDGLGEVLRDFARQTSAQLRDLIGAAKRVTMGTIDGDDIEILRQSHLVLKTAAKVLDMAPVAMQRNKADAIGEKEKMPRAEVARSADSFLQSPDVQRLLASEDAGHLLAAQLSTPASPLADAARLAELGDTSRR
jgi:hypothetical protein